MVEVLGQIVPAVSSPFCCGMDDVLEEDEWVDVLKSRWDAIDRVAATAKVEYLESHLRELVGESFVDDDFRRCKFGDFGEHNLLYIAHLIFFMLADKLFVEYSDMCPVLVDDHKSGLDSRKYIGTLILIVEWGLVLNDGCVFVAQPTTVEEFGFGGVTLTLNPEP